MVYNAKVHSKFMEHVLHTQAKQLFGRHGTLGRDPRLLGKMLKHNMTVNC